MSRRREVYVLHVCHNKKCNNGWLDRDITHCKTNPPKWKYCKKCAEELGIDFDKQKINDTKTDKQKSNEGNLQKHSKT